LATNAGKNPKLPMKAVYSSYSYYRTYIYTTASGKTLWKINENPKVFAAENKLDGVSAVHLRSMKFFG